MFGIRSDPVALGEFCDVAADRHDRPSELVPGDDRVGAVRQLTVDEMDVGPADAAAVDGQHDLRGFAASDP